MGRAYLDRAATEEEGSLRHADPGYSTAGGGGAVQVRREVQPDAASLTAKSGHPVPSGIKSVPGRRPGKSRRAITRQRVVNPRIYFTEEKAR